MSVETSRQKCEEKAVFFLLRGVCAAVVLDYWKQEMAVTGDETESGRVPLLHSVACVALQTYVSFLLLHTVSV